MFAKTKEVVLEDHAVAVHEDQDERGLLDHGDALIIGGLVVLAFVRVGGETRCIERLLQVRILFLEILISGKQFLETYQYLLSDYCCLSTLLLQKMSLPRSICSSGYPWS